MMRKGLYSASPAKGARQDPAPPVAKQRERVWRRVYTRHEKAIREFGFEPAGVIAVGGSFSDLGSIPDETALNLARRIKKENPQADTIHFASAHWATAGAIETIERELGISVMTSHQAITWACLRRAGIADRIAGYGRLLREF